MGVRVGNHQAAAWTSYACIRVCVCVRVCAYVGVAFQNRYGGTGQRDEDLQFHSDVLEGTFVFIRYLSAKTPGAIQMIDEERLQDHIHDMHVTGGGAYKYARILEVGLKSKFHKSDELETLIKGEIDAPPPCDYAFV